MYGCGKCPLHEFPHVDGYGPDSADVVIVGEAPGDTEVAYGRPFVGRAGQLLDKVLKEADIDRDMCYITNACLGRPTPHRAPRAKEIRACRPRLIQEVAERAPKVVIAVGNAALQALLGKRGIRDEHGTVSWSEDVGAFVVPTYHPAAVLRSPVLYIDLLRDVHRAARILKGTIVPAKTAPRVQYTVLRTFDGVLHFVNKVRDVREVSVDVETASDGTVLCIGLSWKANTSVVITREALEDTRVLQALGTFLADKTVIGHNLKHDLQELWRCGVNVLPNNVIDTMLMHYALDERPGTHKLKPLVCKYLSVPDYSAPVARYYSHMEDCPQTDLWCYNAKDAAYTYMLRKVLEREMDAYGHRLLHNLLYPAMFVLARMEHLGVYVDVEYLCSLSEKLRGESKKLEREMFELAGREFNPRSPKQLCKLLYEELELPIPERLSTDERALTMIQDLHPLPAKILEYRGIQKMLRTYVDALLDNADAHGRVHTTFNLHGTVTGRLSSSNPVNLQNIPKTAEARNAFAATPGYKLVECDLSQAEVRVLAWYSGDKNLINALSSGGDLHVRTACIMFNKKPDDVTPEMRQTAKRITFGLIYGKTPESLAKDLDVSADEARELYNRFFKAFPRVMEWIRAAQDEVLSSGIVLTPFGRKRRFELITRENRAEVLRQAVNTPIQSVASDITLSALIRIGQQLGNNQDTRLLLTVHDSILLETREDPYEVAMWTREQMTTGVLDDTVPFDADAAVGDRWGSLEKLEEVHAT